MSTRNIFFWGGGGVKGGRGVGLPTFPSFGAAWFEILEPQPPGTQHNLSRPVTGIALVEE